MTNRIDFFYKQGRRPANKEIQAAHQFLAHIGQDGYLPVNHEQREAMRRLLEARDNSSHENPKVQEQIKSFKEKVLALNDQVLTNEIIVSKLQNYVDSWERDPKYTSVFDDFLFEEFRDNENTDAYLKNLIRFATSTFPHSKNLFFKIIHNQSQPSSIRFLNLLKNDNNLRSNLDERLINFMANKISDINYLEKPMDCLINHMGFQDQAIKNRITKKLQYHQNLLETKIQKYQTGNTVSIEFQIQKIQAYQKLLFCYYQLKHNDDKAWQELIQSLTPSPEAQDRIANKRTLQNALNKRLDIKFITRVLDELSKKSNLDERSQDFIAYLFLLSDIVNNHKLKTSIDNFLNKFYKSFPKEMTRFFWDILDPENAHAEYISDEWREKIISLVAQNPDYGIANFFINQVNDYEMNLYSLNQNDYIASLNFHFLFQTGIYSDTPEEIIFNLGKSPLLKRILKGDLLDFKNLYVKLQKICSEIELDFNSFLEYWFSEIDIKDKLLKLYTENPSLMPAKNQYSHESELEKWFESFRGEA